MPFDPKSEVNYENLAKLIGQYACRPIDMLSAATQWFQNNAPAEDKIGAIHRDDQRRMDRMEHSRKRKEIAAAAAKKAPIAEPVPPGGTGGNVGEFGGTADL